MQHNFKKQFGQNFLQHLVWVERLVEAAELNKNDLVVEIGPGGGVVTERLSQSAGKAISLEIDNELLPVLQDKFAASDNVKILAQDVLQWDMAGLRDKEYKVVASLPYNISKKIINMFLTAPVKPVNMALLIQKEVAFDYVAKKPDATFLGTVAQIYADIELTETVPSNAFFPEPKVDGGILKFSNITPKLEKPEEFIRFIKIGYSSPRKKLSANLSSIGYDKIELENLLLKLQLSASARAQELDLADWQKLYTEIRDLKKSR